MAPRITYDRELKLLNEELSEMGALVDSAISMTIQCFKTPSEALYTEISNAEDEIDKYEHALEHHCMVLITRQQPLAHDLRLITASLKIITDMERISDQCRDIAEVMMRVGSAAHKIRPNIEIPQMLETARKLFSQAMECFMTRNIPQARQVCLDDDLVDAAFNRIILELTNAIRENTGIVPDAVDLMLITKYIERIGDHARNIAEWCIFTETGEHPDLN